MSASPRRAARPVRALVAGFALAASLLPAAGRAADLVPVLHSVSYAGVWRGQARLEVDAFLLKAKELGFSHVELVGKRPHVSPLDHDAAARQKLRARMQELGLTLACLAAWGGGSIENLDRTARRFLETFREMTK